MEKIIVSGLLTLDGVMQSPGGPDEELSEGFNHGGWQLPYFDEIFARSIIEGSKNPYTIEHILYYWGEI
jgi:hypothetical protein